MQDEAHVFELLPGYALGSLDESDAALVGSHLARCPTCRAELSRFQDVVTLLALTAPVESPSPGAKRELMDRIQSLPAREPAGDRAARPPLARRLLPAWGVISLALIVALIASNVLLLLRVNRQEVFTGPEGMRAIALSNNADTAPGASGFVIIGADGQNGVIVVDALPQLGPDQQYQVWLLRDGQSTLGPAFTVDESGYRGARITAPESLLSYTDIRVTIEPIDSLAASSTGAQVLSGSLHNR
jgi:hypothetical protein